MMEKKRRRLVYLTLILVCLFLVSTTSEAFSQDEISLDPARQKARVLLTRLSPEERIGQLFLITLDGIEIPDDSPIIELISKYHVGGVVLKRTNNNFTNNPATLEQIQSLINNLQGIEWQSSNDLIISVEESSLNDFIPIFIGISQSGDLFPNDQYFNGITPMPSQMALGATWDTSLAEEAGNLLGNELSALGFNLLLNPSLDVLETPNGEGKGDLGVRTFGGDPYWVGEMGKAYISGLHEGSSGRIAVIAKNFPGRGSSDRLPDEDVATVRKSLEQLKLIELAPFFEVTDLAGDDFGSVVDGFLLSHIRYQGFQGNIRATTKPVSFDQIAVDLLMNLPPFSAWRENKGILVSDDLGSPAIRKFFNPGTQAYDARQIARNAFLAGNDLLYVDNLVSSGDRDRFETYIKTIELFVQKYREDKAFADRVDASVLRLLTLKYDLFPNFDIDSVVTQPRSLTSIGLTDETSFKITSKAVTLISPKIDLLDEAIPGEPVRNDRIVIFSDVLAAAQCESCITDEIISVNELQNAIIRLYGSAGSAQVNEQNILSYSFNELQDFVENPFNRPELETNLSRADWIVFAIHDQDPGRNGSYALHNLLDERPEVIRNKTVVVFSFNAPYYYDATEISFFTAYYCLYTKVPAAFDTAARLIFKEINPQGSSPVSITGTAYNLLTATSPDPNQIIELSVDQTSLNLPEEKTADGFGVFRLGDNLPIKTGIILDQNGHPVPDGTVVKFMLNQQGENITIQQLESITANGIARTSFKLITPGRHEIRVISEPALNSGILLIDISEGTEAIISAIIPTPIPTIGIEDESSPENIGELSQNVIVKKENNRFSEWLFLFLFSWVSGFAFIKAASFIKHMKIRIQVSLWIIIGGLVSGIWQLMGLPGSFERAGIRGFVQLLGLLVFGEVIFGILGWWVFAADKAD